MKTALITGASSGLGRELAIVFSQSCRVILSGRDTIELEITRNLCSGNQQHISTVTGDLRDTSTRNLLGSCVDLHGLDYLICCAGEYLSGELEATNPDDIQRVLDSNITATTKLVRKLYPRLVNQLDGTIIHINSVAGKAIDSNEPIYCATKHGLAAFFKALRFQAREHNVRVLEVYPGAMQTPMLQRHSKAMNAGLVAEIIYRNAIIQPISLQIEEIHLGRF